MTIECNALFDIGQIIYKIDENSITTAEVLDIKYEAKSKLITYVLKWISDRDTFELDEEYMYESQNWFFNYKEACENLWKNIEEYLQNREKH